MEILASTLGARHRFSTAYVPWSNGTVESFCKEVLRVLHALSTEMRVPETDWPSVVPALQSIINNSPSRVSKFWFLGKDSLHQMIHGSLFK